MQIMKRKMFGVIASIAMILSLFVLPTNVNAESSAKNIYKEEEFINALNDSNINNIVLQENITLHVEVDITHDVILDFNGKTITYDGIITENRDGDAGIIDISQDATVIIRGNGMITYNDANDGGYINSDSTGYCLRIQDNAKLIIENGTLHAALTCVQAGDASSVTIIDGLFRADYSWNNTYWLLNLIDDSSAIIEVYGGTFEHFDPSMSKTENPVANFLGKEATCTQNGTSYVVTHNHDRNIVIPAEESTCIKDGLTEGKKCSICGLITVKQEIISATGHNFVNGKCTVCGTRDPKYVEAPNVDPTQPIDKITVGVNDEESKNNVLDQVNIIIDAVLNEDTAEVKDELSTGTIENFKKVFTEDSHAIVTSSINVKQTEVQSVNKDDLSLIEELLNNIVAENKTNTIIQYFDINVILSATTTNGNTITLGNITQLDKPITFTVAIPEDLMKEGRTFYVIRVHDGKAEKLETVENEDGTLTFKTDKFSTYALAYVDAQESTTTPTTPNQPNNPEQPTQPGQSQDDIKGEAVVTPDNNQQVTNTQNTQETAKEPKTGDTSNIALYGAMALISLGLVGAIVLKKKVSEK